MKKVVVDFKSITPELLEEIVKVYPHGFSDADIISFNNVNDEIDYRVKIILNDTLYMIKKSSLLKTLNDRFDDKFDEDYFSSLRNDDENCDAEFC